MKLRWDPCVVQDASEFDRFLSDYIDRPERRIFLVGGAGFDPRATLVPQNSVRYSDARLREFSSARNDCLISHYFVRARGQYQASIRKLLPSTTFPRIEIFSEGVTAVGGRRALGTLDGINMMPSPTSSWISVRSLAVCSSPSSPLLLAECDRRIAPPLNLHLLTIEQPQFDYKIRGVPAEAAAMLHGFKGAQSLDGSESATLLWIQLCLPATATP